MRSFGFIESGELGGYIEGEKTYHTMGMPGWLMMLVFTETHEYQKMQAFTAIRVSLEMQKYMVMQAYVCLLGYMIMRVYMEILG